MNASEAETIPVSATKAKPPGAGKAEKSNSASMQRAIDRVSRERKVKQNAPSAHSKAKTELSKKTSSSKVSNGLKKVGSKPKASASSRVSSSESSGRQASSSGTRSSSTKSKSAAPKKTITSRSSSTSSNKESPGKKRSKLATVKESGNKVVAMKTVSTKVDTPKKESGEKDAVKKIIGSSVSKVEEIENQEKTSSKVKQIKSKTTAVSLNVDEGVEKGISIDEEDPAEESSLAFDPSKETKKNSKENTNCKNSSFGDENDAEGRDARDITRKMIADILRTGDDELSFEFQGYDVPVSYSPAVDYDMALMAMESSPFLQWQTKMSNAIGTKRLEVRHVEIHSVDFIGDAVDMIKMNTACVLVDDEKGTEEQLNSGVCYLRDNYVALLLELFCIEDETSWSILVDNPRVPIGAVSALELPVGKVDEEEERLFGFEIEEIEEAFGLELNMCDMTDLSDEAYEYSPIRNEGMCPCPGQSGEQVKIMYLRKQISKDHLLMMRSKFSEKREEGALVSLRVVPLADIWKVSADMKVMCALFLLEKLNLSGYESDGDVSVSVRGRRLVTSMLSNVARPLTASSSTRCSEM